MTALRPTISGILRAFFDERMQGTSGVRLQRIRRTEVRLRAFLENEGERGLVPADLALLAAERQIQPADAFCRLMHADDLVFVLFAFVEEPWLEREILDRRMQLALVEKLVARLLLRGLVDREEVICPLLDLRNRLDVARRQLRVDVDRRRRGMSDTPSR
ncbi:hypothetical protein [Aeromicrobium sp.]|uniref:hypothetical protein n=1 Tax=Aeromicrobium sp. TaxID=1871063 RepID=UPI0019B55400|nr:hypothetical protein [Aeromicrobium sp.]MBC7633000.1 hypothetical protein [Aeromicrobium sp.]